MRQGSYGLNNPTTKGGSDEGLVGCWVRRVFFYGAGVVWMWDDSTPGGTLSGTKVRGILAIFLRMFPLGNPHGTCIQNT